jgi:uncharacterized protein YueI
MLQNKLKPAIRTKQLGSLSERVLISHDLLHAKETFRKLKFEILVRSAHSLDFAPSDLHLFGPLNGALGGPHFSDDDDL